MMCCKVVIVLIVLVVFIFVGLSFKPDARSQVETCAFWPILKSNVSMGGGWIKFVQRDIQMNIVMLLSLSIYYILVKGS